MTNPIPTGDHRDRLLDALRAVREAGNPALEASIIACLEGREFSMRSVLPPLHPEIDEIIFSDE